MNTTLIILLVLLIGYLIGHFSSNNNVLKLNHIFTNILLYLLLFVFGINLGLQKEIFDQMGRLSMEILILSVGGIFGSVLLVALAGKIFNRKASHEE